VQSTLEDVREKGQARMRLSGAWFDAGILEDSSFG